MVHLCFVYIILFLLFSLGGAIEEMVWIFVVGKEVVDVVDFLLLFCIGSVRLQRLTMMCTFWCERFLQTLVSSVVLFLTWISTNGICPSGFVFIVKCMRAC